MVRRGEYRGVRDSCSHIKESERQMITLLHSFNEAIIPLTMLAPKIDRRRKTESHGRVDMHWNRDLHR